MAAHADATTDVPPGAANVNIGHIAYDGAVTHFQHAIVKNRIDSTAVKGAGVACDDTAFENKGTAPSGNIYSSAIVGTVIVDDKTVGKCRDRPSLWWTVRYAD